MQKKKESLKNKKNGFSLVEVLLAIAVFTLFAIAFIGALISGQESERLSGERARANFIAKEGLEGVRNIRDENFDNLITGTHGLVISGDEWSFSGSSDTVGIFTRSIIISDIDLNTKSVISTVTWQQNAQRTGSVTLETRFTNWQKIRLTQAEQLVVDISSTDIDPEDTSHVIGIEIENISTYEDITIDQIQVSWSGNGRLRNISIDGSNVWSGNVSSGNTLDITDFTLDQGAGSYDIDYLDFNRDFTGRTITLVFIMSDGSTKQVEFVPGEPPDEEAPDDIADLNASNLLSNSIDLNWTAPGDDGNSGTATSYDIRYSTSTINSSNWNSAIQVSGEPTPDSAGSSESMTVSGLSPSTTYYFAIKTSDEVPNVSGLSNIVSATTLPPTQAYYLLVNTTGATLSGNNITGITLQNTGPADITITTMSVSWSGVSGNRRLTSINIGGTSVWTGSVTSGALENTTDQTLTTGSLAQALILGFNRSINNIVVSVTFNMSDGSSKTVSGVGPL